MLYHNYSWQGVFFLFQDVSDQLHPVQESMVKFNGSQCGFCTPGFVITVKELLETEKLETDEDIRRGLSGNLCRCTGYENIVKTVKELIQTRKSY